MPAARFEIVLGANHQYVWMLYSPDGEVAVTGKGVATKSDAFSAIRTLKQNASNGGTYELRDKDGKKVFRLKSMSHQILAEGIYADEGARERAVGVVRKCAEAAVMDKTTEA